jgi:hypothetical protein
VEYGGGLPKIYHKNNNLQPLEINNVLSVTNFDVDERSNPSG